MNNNENNSLKKEQVVYSRNIYNLKDSGNVFLFALILPILVSLIFSMIANVIAGARGIETSVITDNMWFMTAYSIVSILCYVGIYLVYNKIQKIDFKAINLKFNLKWHTYLIMIVVGVISLFGIQYFISIIDDLLISLGYNMASTSINPTSWGTFFLSVFVLAILPAIGEELIFRGIILNGLRTRFNDIASIFISAILFALMHQNLQQLIYPFLLGSIMAWAVVRSGSLISSVIIHFTNNFLVVLLTFIQNMTGWSVALPREWWFYLIAIVLLLLTILSIFLLDRYYFKHKSKDNIEKENGKIPIVFYVSIGISVLFFLMFTIMNF